MTKVTFPKRVGFYAEVRRRVNRHFEATRTSRNADWRTALKTVAILAWLAAAYALLLFSASSLYSLLQEEGRMPPNYSEPSC